MKEGWEYKKLGDLGTFVQMVSFPKKILEISFSMLQMKMGRFI